MNLIRYEDALIAWGVDLHFTNDVDEFMSMVRDRGRAWNLFITEMSMPPGSSFNIYDPDLRGGLATGRAVIHELERMYPRIPRLLFTHWRELIPDWNNVDRGLYALAKRDYPNPRDFLRRVATII
jgi:hypothetical protein